jgi:hydroxyethylthiazole kinase-like uncharacterized protein yjeF
MEILTGEQMRRIDRRAIEEFDLPGIELMEAAGRGVADALLEDYPSLANVGLVVLCGKGNNGGDGLVAARHLARRGVKPRVLLLAASDDLRGDAAANLGRARDAGLEVREVTDSESWENAASILEGSPVILDALLGTGVKGGARGLAAEVIEAVNRSGKIVASVDLPSGVDADLCEVAGVAVRADRTYTLCRPKLALILHPAAGHAGEWRVIPIGIPDAAVDAEAPELSWTDRAVAARLLPSRDISSHKGTYGHLLAVAGSRGKSGAAVLLARGALRCGVGLMTVATPASAQGRVAVQQAELMTEPLVESPAGNLARGAAEEALRFLADRDALAIGPGLGTEAETREAVERIVSRSKRPLVLDADGLNALSRDAGPTTFEMRPSADWILTPHPGEAGRLLGRSTGEIQADRLGAARALAVASGAVVVLKGHRSLVASPEGRVAINSSGNPGMASGGTGDVLTGAVGAFLARGLTVWDAARLATFVHGDAGDDVARRRGVEGLIATDLIDAIPAALARLAGGETA